jgi:site-specific DNA-methyltransferase (adenine-specific)
VQLILGSVYDKINEIPDNSLDCVLTDPPYGISKKTNFHTMHGHRVTTMDFGEWDVFSTDWIKLLKPKLKFGANVLIFNSWQHVGQISDAMEEINIIPKRMLIYERTNPAPFNRDRLTVNCCDYVVWGVNEGKKWTFNRRENLSYETGIFRYPVQRKTGHTTPKPVGLMKDLLNIFTNENDVVLDCFMGSGTTGLACKKTNRNFIGIEINEEYFNFAKNKIGIKSDI